MDIFKTLFGAASATLSADEVKGRLDEKQPLYLLDVRQPDEFRAGHIGGAKLIPLDELSARLHELPKDRPIVCICRSGSRSGSATRQLNQAGFQALNLRGGMLSWQSASYPIKKDS